MRKSVVAIVAAAAVSGCQVHGHEEDGGPTVSRNYQVGNFQQIEVAGPYDVEVRTGGNASVSAKGSEKLLEKTDVEVKGDKLVIRPEKQHGFFHFGWSTLAARRASSSPCPQLSGATIAGSGDIRVDKVTGQQLQGRGRGFGRPQLSPRSTSRTLKLVDRGIGRRQGGPARRRPPNIDIAGSGDVEAGAVQTQESQGFHRGLRRDQGARHRHRRRQHHGLGRRRGDRRRQVQDQQGRVRRRSLLLEAR